ncbi:MAG: V-type ATP synthase subunit D [Nocardioides sp.]|nr:V-type ATP synthase subunit D [Nocardioides sp.]
MARVLNAPPGRAGRLWLQHRLTTAQQGADLLDHKLRVLRTEREQLALAHERTAAVWEATSREAAVWLLRGVLVGGERAVRLSCDQAAADVQILWERQMGVRYPAEATCALPEPGADSPPTSTAAMVTVRECHRRALEAAVQHAAVEAAGRVLEAEERATRRRLRAIEERWIPRLRQALAEVQLKLEEEEHADGVRLRWASGRRTDLPRRDHEPAGPLTGDTAKKASP